MTEDSGREKPLILVVDDYALHRKAARDILEEVGYRVEDAVDGKEGLEAVERFKPDLVLLDLMMPELDGFEVCAQLRANPEYKQLPIMMVTALDDVKSIDRAYEVGATSFVTKPVNWTLMAYHIKYMLRASHIEGELREVNELLDLARISA